MEERHDANFQSDTAFQRANRVAAKNLSTLHKFVESETKKILDNMEKSSKVKKEKSLA